MAFLAGLGWLGWKSLKGQEAIAEQERVDRLDTSTNLVVSRIQQSLTDIESELAGLATIAEPDLVKAASDYGGRIPSDGLLVIFSSGAVQAYPAGRLLYFPAVPIHEEHIVSAFAAGEAYEDRDDLAGAIQYFDELKKTTDDVLTRAGALVRLARDQRRIGRLDQALGTYSELAQLGAVSSVVGPSDLLAWRKRCEILRELGLMADLAREARALESELNRGHWPLTHQAYDDYVREVRQWIASSGGASRAPADPDALTSSLAETVDDLWEQWQRNPRPPGLQTLRKSSDSGGGQILTIGRGAPDRFVGLVAGPGFLLERVGRPLRGVSQSENVEVELGTLEGQNVLEPGPLTPGGARKTIVAETRLQWQVRVVSSEAAGGSTLTGGGWLLAGGLSFVFLLVVAGTYFSARAMAREMEATRLQSDFVAAVSHEFRTPLTLLRQFSDMLAEGRVSSDEERSKYYAALQRGTRRLTRLVENLLDFQRLEAGSQAFKLKPLAAQEWVEGLTSEFQEEVRSQGYGVEVNWEGPPGVIVRADETVLGRALWNLLDNAVKYSPDCKTIWVDGRLDGDRVTIGVRDRGIGVPSEEQRAIFGKFVRGASSNGHVVKGTGLGLALVQQIVQAHGGTVRLESTVGEGSTFWISLPAHG